MQAWLSFGVSALESAGSYIRCNSADQVLGIRMSSVRLSGTVYTTTQGSLRSHNSDGIHNFLQQLFEWRISTASDAQQELDTLH